MRATSTNIRLLSALALLLLLAFVITSIFLIISNPGLVLLYVICALGLIIGAWLLLTSRSTRVWLGMSLSALAAVGALGVTWALLFHSGHLGLLLFLAVLGVAYSALVAAIARLYWQTRRDAARPPTRSEPAALIVNPKSGNGRATKAHIAQKARDQGIHTVVMQRGQDMVALAEEAIARGTKVLGVSGGDGSLGVLAAVAIKHNLPLVVLPGGTRCHFARDIGLNPDLIADALAGFSGIERRVDVATIGERVFLNNASFGLYAHIIGHDEYRDHKLEVTLKTARELASSKQPHYPLNFQDGNSRYWHHAAQVLVGVNRYETLNLAELGVRKRLDGGILHVIAVRSLSDEALKQLTGNLNLATSPNSTLHQWTATSFEISHPSGWIEAGVDGESMRFESPVQIKILPKALRLLVPPEGIRSRPVVPISGAAAKTLWSFITAKNPPTTKL